MTEPVIIRFTDYGVQPTKDDANSDNSDIGIRRIIGFVEPRYLLPLFDELNLEANPRSSKRETKVGHVVNEILDTLATTPELFHFKSKGILLGCARCEALDRNRFRLRFEDRAAEGILDGGHNMLALGLHMLKPHMDERDWKRIKFWDEMKEAWTNHRDAIEAKHRDGIEGADKFSYLVPVELLVPQRPCQTLDGDDIDAFLMPLLDICAARNNNAQLTLEAKSNKRGFYDDIKERVPPAFAARVEWRPNTWEDDSETKPIKVRDLIAQAWLPLNCLNEAQGLPLDVAVAPQNIYRNKNECSEKFDLLMSHPGVTKQGVSRHVLNHEGVASAFAILADLPRLYDDIYAQFPDAYNSHNRRFGASDIVKQYNPRKRDALKSAGKDVKAFTVSRPHTPFYGDDVEYSYPEGLIAPLFYGLKGLMVVREGKVVWAVKDLQAFLEIHLPEIAGAYQLVLQMGRWDPQKIAKEPSSHEFAVRQFADILNRERANSILAA